MNEPVTTKKPEWVPWKMGWGENMQLARGITLTVGKSDSRDKGFYFQALNVVSKPNFKTMEEAKQRCERYCLGILSEALAKLSS